MHKLGCGLSILWPSGGSGQEFTFDLLMKKVIIAAGFCYGHAIQNNILSEMSAVPSSIQDNACKFISCSTQIICFKRDD